MNEIAIPLDARRLAALLHRPRHARGTVVFVHGIGVDRHDEREAHVRERLGSAGYATLQPELLDPQEACERHHVVDVELQCARLLQVVDWLDGNAWARELPLGFYASGLGASVALLAAARRPQRAAAIVCRSGRPDSALYWLPRVKAPTLFIVDEPDWASEQACDKLAAEHELVVVASGSHRFLERGALEILAQRAGQWFDRYLTASAP